MVSGLCYLQLQEISFLNIQTLHNDCSYIEHVPLLCANLINIFLFLGLLNLAEMFRGCLVCVICNSSSFHSFIFKLCIMIVHTLNMYTLYLCTFDNIFLRFELRNC